MVQFGSVWFSLVLNCPALYCPVLLYSALLYSILSCSVLFCAVVHHTYEEGVHNGLDDSIAQRVLDYFHQILQNLYTRGNKKKPKSMLTPPLSCGQLFPCVQILQNLYTREKAMSMITPLIFSHCCYAHTTAIKKAIHRGKVLPKV